MDPAPILEYVARQLMKNRTDELCVLQKLLQSMAGLQSDANFNDHQLAAIAGGDLLRTVVLETFRDKRAEDTPETMKRLSSTLSRENLAAELLILIAQERQTCIYRLEEKNAPLKVVANLFDEIHNVLGQYMGLMKVGFGKDDYDRMVPSVKELVQDFGLEPAVAWWIARNQIRSTLRMEAPPVDGDIEMKDTAADATDPQTLTTTVAQPKKPHPALLKLSEEIAPLFPDHTWQRISPIFYTTFWQLDSYDIYVPFDIYTNQHGVLSAKNASICADRSDPSIAGQNRRTEAGKQLMKEMDDLQAELRVHIRENSALRKRLNDEKAFWFQGPLVPQDGREYNQRDISDGIVSYCLLPRIVISPNDATFCAKFIRELHKIGTPKFHTVGILDCIFGKCLSSVIFSLTQREAENFGRFLRDTLKDLHDWHASRSAYENGAHGTAKNLTGFMVKGQLFDYEDFRKILYKWHKNLHAAIRACFASGEYMKLRNAISVLRMIVDYFPKVEWIGQKVVERVEMCVTGEKDRNDVKLAAQSLLGHLKKKEKEWVKVGEFQKSEIPLGGNGGGSTPKPANTVPAATTQEKASDGNPKLSAQAVEFVPQSERQKQQQQQQAQQMDSSRGTASAATAAASRLVNSPTPFQILPSTKKAGR